MDGVTISLITLIVTSAVNLLLQLNASIKQRHFESSCSSCCNIKYDSEHKDKQDDSPEDKK